MIKPKKSAEETARTILDFINRRDVPDFITNAVLIAIEGAAIAHGLPQPYMKEDDTDETEAPKIAAVLAAAGEKFGIDAALTATGRSRATKHSGVVGDAIHGWYEDFTELQDLAENACADGFVTTPESVLEMLCIVAKYEDRDDRDALIKHAAERIYHTSKEGMKGVQSMIERAYQANATKPKGGKR